MAGSKPGPGRKSCWRWAWANTSKANRAAGVRGSRSIGQLHSSSAARSRFSASSAMPSSASRSARSSSTGRGWGIDHAPRSVPCMTAWVRSYPSCVVHRNTSTGRPRLDRSSIAAKPGTSGSPGGGLQPLSMERGDDRRLRPAGWLREGQLEELVELGVAVAEGRELDVGEGGVEGPGRVQAQGGGERFGTCERQHVVVQPSPGRLVPAVDARGPEQQQRLADDLLGVERARGRRARLPRGRPRHAVSARG